MTCSFFYDAVHPLSSTKNQKDFDMCMEEKDEGDYCTGWEIKWHFDLQSARCLQFYYGGCKGNANRFTTEEDCLKTCVDIQHITSEGRPTDYMLFSMGDGVLILSESISLPSLSLSLSHSHPV